MTLQEFLAILDECPLIASVQASPGSPLDDPETLLKLAQASLSQGVKVLRLEGVENIKRIKGDTGVPVIGLIKRQYPGFEHYITPTMREVEELLETGCEVIAIDSRNLDFQGTDAEQRCRAWHEDYPRLIEAAHRAHRLVLADCRSASSDVDFAQEAGCDLAATTFNTIRRADGEFGEPCMHDLRRCIGDTSTPVIAEGGYTSEKHVRAAIRAGARGVVIGGALNDPVKQTQRFLKAATRVREKVGAVDIGGTWIRFALFTPDWKLIESKKIEVQPLHRARMDWIRRCADEFAVTRIGVSTGGDYSPLEGMVSTKDTIADNYDVVFDSPGLTFYALNDGLATAWAHSCWIDRLKEPMFWSGSHSATITVGTGLGLGVVGSGTFSSGYKPPHLNDLEFEDGQAFEHVLGGASLTTEPSQSQKEVAIRGLFRAVSTVKKLFQPETLFLAGGVVHSPWMLEALGNPAPGEVVTSLNDETVCWTVLSPFGADAGLYGAAALALFPPVGVFPE